MTCVTEARAKFECIFYQVPFEPDKQTSIKKIMFTKSHLLLFFSAMKSFRVE